MAGRQSGGRNTLFNYFNKVPSKSNGNKLGNHEDNLNKETPSKAKQKRQLDTSNEENHENIQPMKRKRIILESESSDEESIIPDNIIYKRYTKKPEESTSSKLQMTPSKPKKTTSETKCDDNSNPDSDPNVSFNDILLKSSSKTKPEESTSSKIQMTPTKPKKTTSETKSVDNFNPDGGQVWLHNRLEFLKPEKIRDKNNRRPSDPQYDPRTLYVPPDFISKQTPAMQQWWTLKRDHYDCVLFFKVGKFYELYHMDATVGVTHLGFSYMKGEFAHSGFPESAYGRMVSSLVELGYKVARVEQTETPDAMAKRLQNTPKRSKQSKVVSREICQITNKGTRVQGLQDLELKKPLSTYLLAIYENRSNNSLEFGVCFIDTSIGIFRLGQFEDDDMYSRLLTMLALHPPVVILEERKQLSSETKYVLKMATDGATFETLASESQFMSSTKTLTRLQENGYFGDKDEGNIMLPVVLQGMISKDDLLNTTCKKEYDLALKCLGACLWYLKDCLLDIQLFTMGTFERYIPPDIDSTTITSERKFMIMDSSTMSSLHILGEEQTLEKTLDLCCTAMGKRLLHQWICKPICIIEEIRDRQDAISELINKSDLMTDARNVFKTLPDLERLISRIHCFGSGLRAKNHPDSRAIFYEEKTYSEKKIQAFLHTLNGFEKAVNLEEIFIHFESKMLRKYAGLSSDSLFSEVATKVALLKRSFDIEETPKGKKIIPQNGLDLEYDNTLQEIETIKEELDNYLKSQQKYFGCTVTYFGTDKKRFQLDVPEHATHKAGRNYSLEGTKKGSKPSKRYTTTESKALLAKMIAAETRNKEVLHDLNRRVFEKFSENYEAWSTACYYISVLDVLFSLAQYTLNQSIATCVPEVLPFSSTPKLIIKDGVHPFIPNIESFVPNDSELGTEGHPNTLILTGPNMGGKSTLMRQVALLTIMAQLGCHVPASEMKLTLVDRIFTRLGAQDDIITGNSTFLVELKEASAILQHSTKNSLVFLDELGRGTATYDGTAIATAYVDRLIKINCRTIFSTHYYSLLDFFKNNDCIQLSHMACKVESDSEDVTKETVIFMYKMIAGPCPKSYGFNAARLAGIPHSIISRARLISQKLETETIARKLFRMLLRDCENVREILNAI